MKKKVFIFGLMVGLLVDLLRLVKFVATLYSALFGIIFIGLLLGGFYTESKLALLWFFACIGVFHTVKWFTAAIKVEKYFQNFTSDIHKRLA